jgi:hypothetical protein
MCEHALLHSLCSYELLQLSDHSVYDKKCELVNVHTNVSLSCDADTNTTIVFDSQEGETMISEVSRVRPYKHSQTTVFTDVQSSVAGTFKSAGVRFR